MRKPTMAVLALAAILAAGCGQKTALEHASLGPLQQAAAERVARAHAPTVAEHRNGLSLGDARARADEARLILSAPATGDQAAAQPSPAGGLGQPAGAAKPDAGGDWWQQPLAGRSFGEVVVSDLKLFPRELWKSATDSANVPTLVILGAAGGLTAVSKGSWDQRVDRSMRENDKSLFDHEGDFGSIVGNPVLHLGLALAGYGYGVATKNDKLYGYSKSLMQALILTDLATGGLKLAANNYAPNRERWSWPSGHVSSTAALAGVTWEYYGWQAGAPLYLLTGWVATSRLNDREHWLSDVIFGVALGATIGHSVARGRMVEVGGFAVLPYTSEGGAGIMFVKQF